MKGHVCTSKIQSFDELMKFSENRFQQLETIEREIKPKGNEKQVFNVSKSTSESKCLYCKMAHWTQKCEEFKKLSAQEKYKVIKNSNACINCLNPAHKVQSCKSKYKCGTCAKAHHSLLHNDEWTKKPVTVALTQEVNQGTVLLATALILCKNENGTNFVMRALLDQGSQASIITERAAQLLQLRRQRMQTPIKAIGDVIAGTARNFVNLTFGSRQTTNTKSFQTNALIIKKYHRKCRALNYKDLNGITLII